MKLVTIGLLALMLLGGGGAGAYFFFYQPAEASAPDVEEHEKLAHEQKEKDKASAAKAKKDVNFVRLDPLILPILDGEGVSQIVSLVVVLEVNDQFAATDVRRMQPRLKDAYIQEMYGVLNKKAALEGGVLKVEDIKRRLNEISTNVMGEGTINDVLLEVVQQRPI